MDLVSSSTFADKVCTLLNDMQFPGLAMALSGCCTVSHASEQRIEMELHIPFATQRDTLYKQLVTQFHQQLGVQPEVILNTRIENYRIANAGKAAPGKQQSTRALPSVKNVIAIASGKGGVGKSTTAINLALALRQEGAHVNMLDADIFGPSQALLSGLPANTRPEVRDQNMFVPVVAHGLQMMSMGFLITEHTPMVWRGPMASGALQQLFNQTAWDHLDYLIVDMPPGTGDIQLTLSQSCPVTAAVIVTTPQDIALLDAIKGIEMFHKVNVPILGIIENMSVHICSHCGHAEPIFGEGGGERVSREYHVPLLGRLPLDMRIRQQADAGRPTVIAEPESAVAAEYRRTALHMAAALCKLEIEHRIPNVINLR